MDISKKVSFKTFYNQYSEILKKDNRDIYLLRSNKKKNLLYSKNYTLLKQINLMLVLNPDSLEITLYNLNQIFLKILF